MTSHVRATPNQDRFAAETERFRRELLAHCYRMVGSAHDAEDLVQETYLRAWRSYYGFEGRASVRSPDAWITPPHDDPAAVVVARESLRLALIASLQHLPARQRAVLILREVLAFSAAETAEILDTTTAAVKSGLQRARARLDELEPVPAELLEPTDRRARALLDGYIAAFERSDASLLEQVLRTDATLEATPFRDWRSGRAMCIHLLDAYVLGTPGDWRMIATTANGAPAAVVYYRDADGFLRANGAVVLTPTPTGVSRVVAFHHDPALVAMFGFPDVLVS